MFLEKINIPSDLKQLKINELRELCNELREFLQNNTNTKEGHIRSSLGVTELSVALHFVLDTPQDILIWDVGHQAYIHKILTGRKSSFRTNRLKGGISGFTRSSESEYDPFGAGHSSTSISAAVGFALSDKLRANRREVVAVIGDGAFTGGMSFEALNYLGEQQLDVLVILNDNQSSIDANVGALAQAGSYDQYCRSLQIQYLGHCDGNDIKELVERLEMALEVDGPRLLKVNTQKGRGRKTLARSESSLPGFQEVFAVSILNIANQQPDLVAVTPAMLSGSGLGAFKDKYPERCFDVGIAEQHAVTMAAALAAAGRRPLVHLYSTFAQRAYDQIIHDVALQSLPVVFCLDRAGLVGQDGGTHHGSFDPGFLNTLPNCSITAPIDGQALDELLRMAFSRNSPWFIRYPKASYQNIPDKPAIEYGRARLIKKGSGKVVLSFGSIGMEVQQAIQNSDVAHYDFCFLKPLDEETLCEIAESFDEVYTVEENSPRGGLGDAVRAKFADSSFRVMVKSRALPDAFMEHATRNELLELAGLDVQSLRQFLGLS